MYIPATNIDDLLMRVFQRLLKSKNRVKPTRGGNVEEIGVLLKLRNPRARLSRTETKGKIFSCLGELVWYLSKSNSLRFIEYYLPYYKVNSVDGQSLHGAYGPRLFNLHGKVDQMANVLELLRRKQDTRRAVIQLFDGEDLKDKGNKDVPCTCTLQFLVRKRKLYMVANMRSNDAFWGLPHDIFAFTMLQEIMARSLGVELGTYKHSVGSLHLYDTHIAQAQRYLNEGWQETVPMPPMPLGDPWPEVATLVKVEARIRRGGKLTDKELESKGYWPDLARLLQIYRCGKNNETQDIARIKPKMSSLVYKPYIQRKQKGKAAAGPPEQLHLGLPGTGNQKRKIPD